MNRSIFHAVRHVSILFVLILTPFGVGADWKDLLGEAGNQLLAREIDKKIKVKSMKVVERFGNRVILEIKYKRIHRPTNVEMEAYVLRGGSELDGFESTVGTIEEANGKIRLTVTWASAEFGAIKKSDQIKIILSREGSDIKSKIFELRKEWTALTEAEQPGDGGVEIMLGDNTTTTEIGEEPATEENSTEQTSTTEKPHNYHYTARTKTTVKKSGAIKAGNITWKCRGTTCTTTGPWPTPGSGACAALSKMVGQISSYGHTKKRLTSADLARCNGARQNYHYTARTKTTVKKSGAIKAGNITWKCRGTNCTTTGPWPTPGSGACAALSKIVGQISSYGHPKKRLTSADLARCNSARQNYHYTARTKTTVKKSGAIKAGNITWKCRGTTCTTTGPWPTPGSGACAALSKIVGQISSYGHPNKRLSTVDLKNCNAAHGSVVHRAIPSTTITVPKFVNPIIQIK